MIQVRQYGAPVADPFGTSERLLCSFSAGAASAVATKLAIEQNDGRLPVKIVYFNPGSEHEDNERFIYDCARWFGYPVETMRSAKYRDTWDVFRMERWLVGPQGAKCTTVLKKHLADKIERPTDLHTLGYDASERRRALRFWQNQPEVRGWFPLIDAGITKEKCFSRLAQAGIPLPAMYLLGYRNNNCIGCVKGGTGYWNKIRRDFPETFDRMAKVERELGAAICKTTINGVRQKVFLDELDPNAGRYEDEPSMSCGVTCQQPDLFEEAAA